MLQEGEIARETIAEMLKFGVDVLCDGQLPVFQVPEFENSKLNNTMPRHLPALLIVIALLVSCKDDIAHCDYNPTAGQNAVFTASFFVEVKDEAGQPVDNANVSVGDLTTFTNEIGVAYLKDAGTSRRARVQVDHSGFFEASRVLSATPCTEHRVEITLLEKRELRTFNAESGATVGIGSDLRLVFPEGAIVDKNGNDYKGTVVPQIALIAADDPELHSKMPGDLVGRHEDGEDVFLGSYGMFAAELVSPAGQELAIKPGKTVNMAMKLPDSHLDHAPEYLPMWYYNEESGFWEEEGTATLEHGYYLASVTHFSYWNCDDPYVMAEWGAYFKYPDGSVASNIETRLTIANTSLSAVAYTDIDGYASGFVPRDRFLELTARVGCDQIQFVDQVKPLLANSLDNMYVIENVQEKKVSISGTLKTCDDLIVSNGYVIVTAAGIRHFAGVDDSGYFNVEVINCDTSDMVIVFATADMMELPEYLQVEHASEINLGTYRLCGDNLHGIIMDIEGIPNPYTWVQPGILAGRGQTWLFAPDSSELTEPLYCTFQGETEGTYPVNEYNIRVKFPNGEWVWAFGTPTIQITEFGNSGEIIKGSIRGKIAKDTTSANAANHRNYIANFNFIR